MASNATAQPQFFCRPLRRMFYTGFLYNNKNPLELMFARILVQSPTIIILIRILQFILRPFKQPRIVSEILAGIILGPSVLGRNKKYAEVMIPKADGIDMEIEILAKIAMIYFIFITSVKMDTRMVFTAGKKATVIAVSTVIFPLLATLGVTLIVWKYLDKDIHISEAKSITGITGTSSMTAFLVLHPILTEIKLLNSRVGRLAMSVSMISDALGWIAIIVFDSLTQGEVKLWSAFAFLSCFAGIIAFIAFVLLPVTFWIIRKTPPGTQVEQRYIIGILLVVLVSAVCADLVGSNVVNGPMILGLAIPDGPPLGSTLVDRSETLILDQLMPFFFIFIGQKVDIFCMKDWQTLLPILLILIVGYLTKYIGTLIPLFYFKTPIRDALSLGLMLSLRGQAELFLYQQWRHYKMLNTQSLTVFVLSSMMATVVGTPIICALEGKSGRYILEEKRSIHEQLRSKNELNIVSCVHEQANVPAILKVIDASHPTEDSPITLYALHLVQLVGRSTPMLISHDVHKKSCRYRQSKSITRALRIYQQVSTDRVNVHAITAVSPYSTIHQDICRLALENEASLIIYPYYRQNSDVPNQERASLHAIRRVLLSILMQAPCSIGILVERVRDHNQVSLQSLYNTRQLVAVLFLGGADSREVLSIADRIAGNSSVKLKVARILSIDNNIDEREKLLDDECIKHFNVKHAKSSHVAYRQVRVKDGVETVKKIRKMTKRTYDLWIVGRRQEDATLLTGLSEWVENTELGIMGDILCSPDFAGTSSVLVVQR